VLLQFEFKNGPQFPFSGPDNPQYLSYKGEFTDPNWIGQGFGTLPDWQITSGLSWEFRNFTYTVSARYVPEVLDPGDNHPYENGGVMASGNNGATVDGSSWHVSDWYSIDMQLAYEIKSAGKWYDRTRFTVGCNNVTDNGAPLIASSTEDHTDKSTYDILGRFVYFEVSKKF
jgi:outer membrane receptor protein involved in Fe transport